MRTLFWITLIAISLLWAGCDPADDDDGDDDTSDDDTSDDDTGDDDTGDDDTGDDDTGDDDTGDDDTGDDDIVCDVTVPTDQPTVQDGITDAADGEVVCVEPGTYVENVDFLGKEIHLVALQGPSATILDGGGAGSVVDFHSQEGPDAILDGFTVTNGLSTQGNGAGIHVDDANPTLRNLIVESNEAMFGGGLSLERSAATCTNMVVRSNMAAVNGAGVFLGELSYPTLSNVLIEGNSADPSADTRGGGIFTTQATVVMSNVILRGNEAKYGGGMYTLQSDITMSNAAVVGNTVPAQGAGLEFAHDTVATLTNVLIAHNTGQYYGGGVHLMNQGELYPVMSHCNVYGNAPENYAGMPDPTGSDGNLSVDPVLLDTASKDPLAWDLHLDTSSPLIDAGDAAILDPDGSPSDIGAYGGPGAGGFDLDLDGYFQWWLPGAYDAGTSPGMDCDDADPSIHAGNGC